MIYRPRAGTRPDGTHRSRIEFHRSPSDASGGRSLVSGPPPGRLAGAPNRRGGRCSERGWRRTAGDRRRSLNAAPRPGRCPPSGRSHARYATGRGVGAIGNPPHPKPTAGRSGGWDASPGRILRSVPGLRRGDPDRGGPAIARSGRVVRPVRRPTDRQTNRRSRGGDQREICNQIPRPSARDLSIHGSVGASV